MSLRFPTWALPLFLLLLVAFFLTLGYFVDSRANLEKELAQYKNMVALESSRQEGMRDTILSQQDEVKRLSAYTTQFQSDLLEVDRLTEQVRGMMGLATPTPPITPTATVTASNTTAVGGGASAALAALAASSQRSTTSRGDRAGMGLVDANVDEIDRMRATLPGQIDTLAALIDEATRRLDRIDPEQRTNKDDLEYQLKLLAAAPHAFPLDGDVRISSEFGYRTLNGIREFHTGVDLTVWYGNPVKATLGGTVIHSGWMSGYGYAVEIEHSMGFTTVYAHNSRLLVKRGDQVQAGDVIAKSGSTGNSTGPHVHYEVRLYGKAVDPMKYIGLDSQN